MIEDQNPKHAYRLVVLKAMPATQAQIREKTGLGAGTICRWVKDIHETGECHIGGWVRTAGKWAAIYHPGVGKDKPEPIAKTRQQREAKYRRKAEAREVMREADRRRYWAKKGVTRDPLTAALFGGVTPH